MPHFCARWEPPAVYIFLGPGNRISAGGLSNLESRLWSGWATGDCCTGAGVRGRRPWDYGRLATGDRYFYELDGDIYEVGLYIKQRTEGRDLAIYGDTQLMQYGTIRGATKESPAMSFDSRWAIAFPLFRLSTCFSARTLRQGASSDTFRRTPGASRWQTAGKETVVGYRTDGRSALEYNRTVRSAPLWAQRPPAERRQPATQASPVR